MKNRAVVTGGGGYVGTKLCLELVRRGYTVTALDVQFPITTEDDCPKVRKVKVRTG